MRTILLLFTLQASLLTNEQIATVDLSHSAASFPTIRTTTEGCNSAYDSNGGETPARCIPYPVTIQIKAVSRIPAEDRSTVEVRITNVSDDVIRLPRSPEETARDGEETFITLGVHSPPGSLNLISYSLAFSEANTPSSVVSLRPNESVVYVLPFDRGAVQQAWKGRGSEKPTIQVELAKFVLHRGASKSEDVSIRNTNSIISKPFTLAD